MASNHFFYKNKVNFLIVTFFCLWAIAAVLYSCREQAESADNDGIINEADRVHPELVNADYTGSESCKSCHEQEYDDWEGSHHDKAMMTADENSILANFDTTFTNQGVTSKFYAKDNKYFVNTEGPDGQYHDYEIIYTFGYTPLQQIS